MQAVRKFSSNWWEYVQAEASNYALHLGKYTQAHDARGRTHIHSAHSYGQIVAYCERRRYHATLREHGQEEGI